MAQNPPYAAPPPGRAGFADTGDSAPPVNPALKWLVAAGTLIIPLIGMVMGIIYLNDANPAKKSTGKLWLWVGIAAALFWILIRFGDM